jgi:tetratricopeptide (TPR) repeat protein
MKFLLTILLMLLAAISAPLQLSGRAQSKPTVTSDFASRPASPISAEAARDMETRLMEARARYEAEPQNPDAAVWLGRRLAYLGRFTEAIEVYSLGIKTFPRDARFYRHRGHRYITLRKFQLAIADFQKAVRLTKGLPDEIEPDGQPNARNIPTGTLQFNIWYHLGLAQYLTGQNTAALKSYRECLKVSHNPDSIVATTHWLYMTLRRLNRTRDAMRVLDPIQLKMDIIENDGYYKLVLMYKGLLESDTLLAETLKQGESAGSLSVLYGIANWHLYNGRRDKAVDLLRQMTAGQQWTSFGFIAAEADLKRLDAIADCRLQLPIHKMPIGLGYTSHTI